MARWLNEVNMFTLKRTLLALCAALAATAALAADKEHGTVISEVTLFVTPDLQAQKLGRVTRGRDIFLMDHTTVDKRPWAHLLAVVDVDVERETMREISGWVPASVVVTTSTPNGDQVIFGEAVDSENQAELRGGRKNAAQDAMRLYYRLYEYFPSSPLAGEALWRAADIRWQLEKADVRMRPSSQEMSPDMRTPMSDENLKLVIKKFPHTKWADQAAFNLIDNKLCGSWKGETHCPEKESELYEKYAREHPQSPKVAEALFNAAWRQAVLVDMYNNQHEKDKSEKARKKAMELAQEVSAKSPESDPKLIDWKPRAMELMYSLQQGIPTYEAEADRK
jgi:outer membrane protein assembly factor BamD (BamD/ComL family)